MMLASARLGLQLIAPTTDKSLNALLSLIPLVLMTIGSTLPAYERLQRVIRDQRDLLALRRLWCELTDAVPSVRLGPVRNPLAEAVDLRATRNRLYRRTIEIRDAVLALSDHAPDRLRDAARTSADQAGLRGTANDHATEAYWIRAAHRARLTGAAPEGSAAPPSAGGHDLRTEIAALRQMSGHYFSPAASAFALSTVSTEPQELPA
jgi:hypothetical protein